MSIRYVASNHILLRSHLYVKTWASSTPPSPATPTPRELPTASAPPCTPPNPRPSGQKETTSQTQILHPWEIDTHRCQRAHAINHTNERVSSLLCAGGSTVFLLQVHLLFANFYLRIRIPPPADVSRRSKRLLLANTCCRDFLMPKTNIHRSSG